MRKIINLNDNWQFIQKDVGLVNVMPTDWQTVNLPHTWNAVDGHDGNGRMIVETTGMRKHLKLQRKRLVVLKYL